MSVTGTFDVLRIVEQARLLTSAPTPKMEHPIGLGLRAIISLDPTKANRGCVYRNGCRVWTS